MTFELFIKIVTAAFMTIATIFNPAPKAEICMIAHRGYSGIFPENTSLAFEKAASHGFGGAETDIRVTSDGVYVTSHNGEIEFEDGTTLEIATNTFSDLTAKPLRNKKTLDKVYLCTFEKYLEIMAENNMICFIELKGDFTKDQVKEIFELAEKKYDLSKCILQSFRKENLLEARELFPELPLMLTYGNGDGDYSFCFDYGFSIDAEYTACTEEMVDEFHSRGLQVGVWTADELFVLNYCKSLGVDYIESDLFA